MADNDLTDSIKKKIGDWGKNYLWKHTAQCKYFFVNSIIFFILLAIFSIYMSVLEKQGMGETHPFYSGYVFLLGAYVFFGTPNILFHGKKTQWFYCSKSILIGEKQFEFVPIIWIGVLFVIYLLLFSSVGIWLNSNLSFGAWVLWLLPINLLLPVLFIIVTYDVGVRSEKKAKKEYQQIINQLENSRLRRLEQENADLKKNIADLKEKLK